MSTFKTPQELLNYIPNCILCGKEMSLLIEGTMSNALAATSQHYMRDERLRVLLERKDNILYSKRNKHSITLEIDSGKIIDGKEIFSRMRMDYTNFTKFCNTCDFKILSQITQLSKGDYFPILRWRNERLHYTLRGGREVEITRGHYDPQKSSVRINKKFLPPMPGLEFSKFTNLDQLNQRLSTIIVFG
jgi:hypothetical protein